jgi:DNA-binding NtrC family response regulator
MSSKLAKILYGEADAEVLAMQTKMFQKAGYTVVSALGRQAIEVAALQTGYDLVILGHTLSKDDRHHLPYKATRRSLATRVLVLHASGKHPEVDLAIDSRAGDAAVLAAVAQLLNERERSTAPQHTMAATA